MDPYQDNSLGPVESWPRRSVLLETIESAPDGILILDPEGGILHANRCMAQLLECPADTLVGQSLLDLIPDQCRDELRRMLAALSLPDRPKPSAWLSTVLQQRERDEISVDMQLRWLETDVTPYITTFVRDMTEQRRQEYLLRSIATHDDLTGLPNRMQLGGILASLLAAPADAPVEGALLLLDLDQFRQVNESLSHEFGDLLLMAVCARLIDHLPPGSPLIRFSGDVLVALLAHANRARVTQMAEDILMAMQRPILINDWEYRQSLSLGIALIPADGRDVSQLVRKADLALGWAKAAGRSTYAFYDGPVAASVERRHRLRTLLHQALERDEFHLHYQPRVDLTSGRIVGWEALLRWNHPEEGPISPAEFIPVAEDSGLILGIGDWVLRRALRQQADWQALGFTPGVMAVNLSAYQLRQPNLIQRITAALTQAQVRPEDLELEITETTLMTDVASARRILTDLSRMGVKLAVDDFGTGYSSLGYLRAFPLDRLKIDRSFVSAIGGDQQDEAIARTILVLAHSLDLSVVAEGVETEAQLRYLISHRCEEIQGFLFSRPLPVAECERLLREDRRLEI